MIKHIVMWRVKDETKYGSKEEALRQAKEKLEALKSKISEIVFLEAGINYNTTEAAYDLVLYSEFKTDEDLQTYQVHPEHLKVVEFMKEIVVPNSRVVVDYESN
mgnify:FL=1